MCLILFSYKEHKRYKLVIAANRDEFYDRPTIQADYWKDHPNILGGIDQTAGGTWMGVNQMGKISMLTNYRDLRNLKENAPSRGHLVGDFLKNDMAGEHYLADIPDNGKSFNGYNLVVGTVDNLHYQSNYSNGIIEIQPGTHGLSNHLLDTQWPKVALGTEKLKALISQETIIASDVFDLMYDGKIQPDDKLPDTGIGLEMERMLSSMFIKSPRYGSRCTTLILVDWENNLSFYERTYNTSDFSYKEKEYQFRIEE